MRPLIIVSIIIVTQILISCDIGDIPEEKLLEPLEEELKSKELEIYNLLVTNKLLKKFDLSKVIEIEKKISIKEREFKDCWGSIPPNTVIMRRGLGDRNYRPVGKYDECVSIQSEKKSEELVLLEKKRILVGLYGASLKRGDSNNFLFFKWKEREVIMNKINKLKTVKGDAH